MNWRARLQSLSLRQQLRVSLIAVLLLALSVSGTVMLLLARTESESRLRADLGALGMLLANRSSAAVAFADDAAAQENLDAVQAMDFVGRVCVFDQAGRVMAAYPREQVGAGCPLPPAGRGQTVAGPLSFGTDILSGGQRVGRLWLQSRAESLRERMGPWMGMQLLAFVLAGLAALVVAAPLQAAISAPMRQIRRVVDRVVESADFSLRAPPLGQHEFGRLSDAFNRMLVRIEEQNVSLASREHYARALFESSQHAQLVLDRVSGLILEANPAAALLLGGVKTDALKQGRLADFVLDEPALAQLLGSLVLEQPVRQRWRMRRGELVWDAEVQLLRVELIDKDEVHVGLDDITQRLADERALLQANEELEQRVAERTQDLEETIGVLNTARDQLVAAEKQLALGRLVAGMAHEINTPVGNARLALSSVSEAGRELSARMLEGLRRSDLQQFLAAVQEGGELADRNLTRVAALIETFKQMAADQASSQRRRFSLASLVQDVLSLLAPQLRRSQCELVVEVPPGLDMESHAGPLDQVLMNLIQNALMHGFDGVEPGQARLHLSASEEAGEWVRLSVSDNGRGIAPDVLPKIFDPFFTTRLGRGGLGLGLSISQGLVQQVLGGRVTVDSTPGQGTCFELWLPKKAPTAHHGPADGAS